MLDRPVPVSRMTKMLAAEIAGDDALYIVDKSAGELGSKQVEIDELQNRLQGYGVCILSPSGDTTGATDLANITAADAELTALGGGVIRLAPGSYYSNGTIVLSLGVGIEAIGSYGGPTDAGSPVTITHTTATAAPMIINYTISSGYGYIGNIRGIRLVANANSTYGIFLQSIAEFRIFDCALMNFTVGIRCAYTLCSVVERTYIEGKYLGGNFGLEVLAGGGQSTTIMLRDCRIRRQEYCVSVNTNACHSLWLDNCIFESCRAGIARLRNGHTVINNAYVEAMNGTSGVNDLVVASDGAEYELSIVSSTNTEQQLAPVAITDGNTALTVANIKNRLLTMTTSTADRLPTVPTGTAVYGTETNSGIAIDQSIDWTFINTGTRKLTVSPATGHTLVGGMDVEAGSSATFRTRCTAVNTAVTYRLDSDLVQSDSIFNVKTFGAVGDGVTEDTSAIQAAITAANVAGGGQVVVPYGTYLSDTITLASSVQLLLNPGVTILSVDDLASSDYLLHVPSSVTDVSIIGYGAIVTMDGQYTSGEQRHGLGIENAQRVIVKGIKFTECGGDGIRFGGSTTADITIEDCWCDKNRRQGCSVSGGNRITFNRCRFSDTGRGVSGYTSPMAGVDVEPLASRSCRDIAFRDCIFENNTGAGLVVNTVLLDADEELSVSVSGCHFRHNYGNGITLANLANTHTAGGRVFIEDCKIFDQGATGLYISDWWASGPRIIIRDNTFRNGNAINSTDYMYRSWICIDRPAASTNTYDVGNVLIDGCDFTYTKASTDTGYFAYSSGSGTTPVPGDTVTDNSSGATGTVANITITSGAFSSGNAAGVVRLRWQTGTFVASNGVTFSSPATATCGTVTAVRTVAYPVYGVISAGSANVINVDFNNIKQLSSISSHNVPTTKLLNGTNSKIRCNIAYAGDPTGLLTASIGSVYRQTDSTDGSALFIKESGDNAIGWVAQSNDIFNAKAFGAIGDGTTDDTSAIQAAIDAAADGTLIIPPGTYKLTSVVTIGSPLRIEAPYAKLKISHNGTGILCAHSTLSRFGTSYSRPLYLDLHIYKDTVDQASGSIGIKVINANNSEFHLREVSGFEQGVLFTATVHNSTAGGCCYNNIFLYYLRNNTYSVTASHDTGGWCNENTFYGGTFGGDPTAVAPGTLVGSTHIRCVGSSSPAMQMNNNIFIRPSLEGKHDIGFSCIYADSCGLISPRIEMPYMTYGVYFSTDAHFNYVNEPLSITTDKIYDASYTAYNSVRFYDTYAGLVVKTGQLVYTLGRPGNELQSSSGPSALIPLGSPGYFTQNASGTVSFSLKRGRCFRLTPTGDATIAITDLPTSPYPLGELITILIVQGATPYTVTFGSGFQKGEFNDPVKRASSRDVYQAIYEGNSGKWVIISHSAEDGTLGKGSAATTAIVAREHGNFAIHKTVLTLTSLSLTIIDRGAGNVGYGGVKVYDFPAGAIEILGASANVTLLAGAGGIVDDWDGDFSLGTVTAAADNDLTGTEANVLPKTATIQATSGTGTAQGKSTTTEIGIHDGTSTAIDAYLNVMIDDADISSNDTLAASGTITLVWVNLGDY